MRAAVAVLSFSLCACAVAAELTGGPMLEFTLKFTTEFIPNSNKNCFDKYTAIGPHLYAEKGPNSYPIYSHLYPTKKYAQ